MTAAKMAGLSVAWMAAAMDVSLVGKSAAQKAVQRDMHWVGLWAAALVAYWVDMRAVETAGVSAA